MIELSPEQHLRNELARFLSQLPSPCTPQVIGEQVVAWLSDRGVQTLPGSVFAVRERAKKAQSRLILADEIVDCFWDAIGDLRMESP